MTRSLRSSVMIEQRSEIVETRMNQDKLGNVDWTIPVSRNDRRLARQQRLARRTDYMHVNRPLGGHAFRDRMSQSWSCNHLAAANEQISEDRLAPPNHFSVFESAVNLYIPPLEFAMKAEIILDVDTALAILSEMGFEQPACSDQGQGNAQGCDFAYLRGWAAIKRRTTSISSTRGCLEGTS